MTDLAALWDFDDATGSEARLRRAADDAAADGRADDRDVLMTQVARALALQARYAEAHEVLDALAPTTPEAIIRVGLERGRVLCSSGHPAQSRPLFEAAALAASEARLDALAVDALHMVALVAEPESQLSINEQALAIARASAEPTARDWDASLLNNIGMVHADAGDFAQALASFEEALAARERIGDPARTRIARWMVAWALRNLGRAEEALALQRGLKAELDAAGLADPYVEEELALLES